MKHHFTYGQTHLGERAVGLKVRTQSVERALSVLECFGGSFLDGHAELTLAQVARCTGLPKASVLRILNSLVRSNYLERGADEDRYRLGPKPVELARAYLAHLDVRRAAAGPIRLLRDETQETVGLSVLAGDRRVCVEAIESPLEVRRSLEVGASFPLHCGSASKVLLAFQPPERRAKLLEGLGFERLAPRTITDRAELEKELDRVRRRGYAVGREERVPGGAGVAAPVFGPRGEVVAVLGVYMPASRLPRSREGWMVERVRSCAGGVSKKLGYGAGAF